MPYPIFSYALLVYETEVKEMEPSIEPEKTKPEKEDCRQCVA